MTDELQRLVELAAGRTGAPTLLEDRAQRMIAFCDQGERIDDIRRSSILRRTTASDIVAWFAQFDIHSVRTPVRTPSHPERGILGRLCVPLRYQDRLMGFLWLIDDEGVLTGSQAAEVAAFAKPLGLLIYRQELAARMEGDIVDHLLSPSPELRRLAAQDIVNGELLHGESYAVAALQVVGASTDASAAIADALWEFSMGQPTRRVLRLARRDHGAVVIALPDADARRLRQAREVAADAHRILCTQLPPGVRSVVGIGAPETDLVNVVSSYHQARLAAGVSAAIPSIGDATEWENLGVFRVLALLPPAAVRPSVIDPRLRTILDAGDEEVVHTLEAYLDNAGNVKQTADSLFIHRGTLYYRLSKAEKLAGIDLQDGDTRLALHLAFKLLRLLGAYPDEPCRRPASFANLAAAVQILFPSSA